MTGVSTSSTTGALGIEAASFASEREQRYSGKPDGLPERPKKVKEYTNNQKILKMDFNQFTIKSQEAIKNAEEIAKKSGNQSIENVHLLKALIKSDDYLIPNLFTKLGVNIDIFNQVIDKTISSLPRVQG